MVDFIAYWQDKSGCRVKALLAWVGICAGKYHRWKARYGQPNIHNASLPRAFWLLDWEKAALIAYALQHPDVGYRRLTYMMLDADVVAVSQSSTYRVLKCAGVLPLVVLKSSKKGKGFDHPEHPHQHWHIDITYINICGTFYYLCALLDGYSRYIVHFEIREQMKEADVEIIIQRARERFAGVHPRIISDNGPQFIAKEFKTFVRMCGMTHVRTTPFYPQSNGKLERWNRSLKQECIRPKTPTSLFGRLWQTLWHITTKSGSTVLLDILHQPINYTADIAIFFKNVNASWLRRESIALRPPFTRPNTSPICSLIQSAKILIDFEPVHSRGQTRRQFVA